MSYSTICAGDGAFERRAVRSRLIGEFFEFGDPRCLFLWDALCKRDLEEYPEDLLIEDEPLPF